MLETNFQPFPVLGSQRLVFRQLTAADADRIFQLRSEPAAMEFIDKAPMKNKEEALTLINLMLKNTEDNNAITWAIALKEDELTLIGTIGYWRIEKEHYRAEIGYMLLPQYFNKGYMTEAIQTISKYAFEKMGLHSIEANINPANKASEAILLKSGFLKEAHFRENYYYNGVFLDSAIFSLIKPK